MKIKIVGILICTILISSNITLALLPTSKDYSVKQTIDGAFIITTKTASFDIYGHDKLIVNNEINRNKLYDKAFVPFLLPIGWIKVFGGVRNDWGRFVQQTTNGGFIIVGDTDSFGAGGRDVWLINIDSFGNMLWNKSFGGTENDYGYSVQQTTDGGFIITGATISYSTGDGDVWLIKTDSNGNKEWDKTFGGIYLDSGFSVRQTTDGGFIITGWTFSVNTSLDVWLIKTDSNGNREWDKTFGETGDENGLSVQQTTDGGYFITGWTHSFGAGEGDVWLIKTDSYGNKIWDRRIGGIKKDAGLFGEQTSDSGYIITGYTFSYSSNESLADVWLIKTDSNGNKVWNKTFGGIEDDLGESVQETTDGGYIITGWTTSFGASEGDVWLIKTNGNGDKKWDNIFGGTDYEKCYSIQQTRYGGYIIVGCTYSFGAGGSDVLLIKTDSKGKSKTSSLDNLWFEWLFQRFPHSFPLLRILLK